MSGGHALKFLDWMLEVVDRCETPERLNPIYTLSGSHLPPEAELGHLAGFAQSRPVRIGNAAANQVQLDVFGPIVHRRVHRRVRVEEFNIYRWAADFLTALAQSKGRSDNPVESSSPKQS